MAETPADVVSDKETLPCKNHSKQLGRLSSADADEKVGDGQDREVFMGRPPLPEACKRLVGRFESWIFLWTAAPPCLDFFNIIDQPPPIMAKSWGKYS
jgi:hypothetical protein